MSFQPFILPSVNGVSNPIHDDIQYYDTYADILAEQNKSDMVTYVARDTGNRYTWDGASLAFLIGSSGAIMSASNVGTGVGVYKELVSNDLKFKTLLGITNQVNIANNTNDLTLSLPQSIATTSNVLFNSVDTTDDALTRQNLGLGDNTTIANGQLLIGSSTQQKFVKTVATGDPTYITAQAGDGTLAITMANQAKTKIDNAIQSITSANTNLLSVSGTTAITLTPQIGGGEPLLYTYTSTGGPNPSNGELKITSAGNFTVATAIVIDYRALNRSDDNFIKTYLRSWTNNNLEILLLNDSNVNDYANFYVTSTGTVGANNITFNVSYDASGSASTTFTSPTIVKMFLSCVDRIPVSSNTNLLTVTNTNTSSTIVNKIGSMQPAILRVDTTMVDNQKFVTNNNALLSSSTQVSIGRLPFNVGDAEYFHHVLDLIQNKCLPMRIRVTVNGTSTQYAEFTLTSPNGSTANAYQFFSTFDGTRSTITSLTTASFVNINFMPVQRTVTAGTGISVVESSNKETLTISTTGVDINNATRNLLSRINLHVFTFPASFTLPVTYSLSANESLTLNMSVANDVVTNYLLAFKATGHPQRALHYTTSSLKQTIFGVRLSGANWTGASIDRCRIGWCSAQFYENVEGNFPSAVYLIQPASNNVSTSANRAYTTGFLTTGGYFNQNGVSTLVSRTGYTTDAIGLSNDIILTTWDAVGGFYLTMWYRGTSERSRLFGVMPNGTGLNNFMSSDLSPIVSIGNSGAGWNIEILSERDLTALGITFANNTNYFY